MDINNILEKRMTRKEFITRMAVFAFAALFFSKATLNKLLEEEKEESDSQMNRRKEWVVDGVKVMSITE